LQFTNKSIPFIDPDFFIKLKTLFLRGTFSVILLYVQLVKLRHVVESLDHVTF
jgi:hypothetical protein